MISGKKRNLSHIIIVEIVVSYMLLTEFLMENTPYFQLTLPMKGLMLLGLFSLPLSFGAFAQNAEGAAPCACPPAADRPVVIVTDNGDGCVTAVDLLDLLSAYGEACSP